MPHDKYSKCVYLHVGFEEGTIIVPGYHWLFSRLAKIHKHSTIPVAIAANFYQIVQDSALLQFGILLPPLLRNLLLAKLPCLTLQQCYPLLVCELHLIAHRYQAVSDVIIVLAQQIDRKHHVIDIVENKRMLIRILFLLRQKCDRVVAPVTKRIEMVRGVIAVIVAVSITLS